MSNKAIETVLITGANSGVGLEAAAQFAEAGWGTVILAARSKEKGTAAKALLRERTSKDVFETLVIDTSEVASAGEAAISLGKRGRAIDVMVLNAGASSSEAQFNSEGLEVTWSSTLVGHHVLTMRLLEAGLLGPRARIIIAGSEGARGNLPGMRVHDIPKIAAEHFDGDIIATIKALAQIKHQPSFSNMDEYVTAKTVVAWWAGALSRKLPKGMIVNAVSPGSAPTSNFARGAGFGMRLMIAGMKVFGPLMGMAGSIEQAARRYVEAAQLGPTETGHFYATAHPKKLVGPVAIQTWPEYFTNRDSQDSGFDAIAHLTKTPFPATVASYALT